MITNEHRIAVLATIDVVNTVQPADLDRPTPCAGWDLADLLAHMTAQHRGFAAAARGHGGELHYWRADTVVDGVRRDPGRTYSDAAHDVLDAFSVEGIEDASFALPEFGDNAAFPGSIAMGFHFVDYVVHGWDVAAALGVDYELPADVLTAAMPLVLAVPTGEVRLLDVVPFDPAIESVDGASDLDRILCHLGRRPHFTDHEASVATYRGPSDESAR